AALQTLVPETAKAPMPVEPAPAPSSEAPARGFEMHAATKARLQGYEGEACNECGHYTLVRNGTCLKCDTCGSTTGCS
ncbi:MAG: hypothetical protein AAFQ28_00170, partial [Pseudomonadota bacterium]